MVWAAVALFTTDMLMGALVLSIVWGPDPLPPRRRRWTFGLMAPTLAGLAVSVLWFVHVST